MAASAPAGRAHPCASAAEAAGAHSFFSGGRFRRRKKKNSPEAQADLRSAPPDGVRPPGVPAKNLIFFFFSLDFFLSPL